VHGVGLGLEQKETKESKTTIKIVHVKTAWAPQGSDPEGLPAE
jgi:hypothetical protein